MGKAKENEEEKLFAFRAVFGLGRDGQIMWHFNLRVPSSGRV